jgi:hypothetical protein
MSTLETLMIVFIAVTSVAVVVQMCVLIGMSVAFKKSAKRMEGVADQLEANAIPLFKTAQEMISECRPKLKLLLNNLADTSTTVKEKLERADGTLNEVIDRTRLQVIRVDELLSRTLDSVEGATELVQQSVAAPVRQASGVIQGISVALSTLFHKGNYSRGKGGAGVPKEDMFI